MGKYFLTLLFSLALFCSGFSQETSDSVKVKNWNVSAVVLPIFMPDKTFVVPVVYANYKRWHFEPRYNYENMETFSMFVGYNFVGGNRMKYILTPMLGGVVGKTDGLAPGFEADLVLGRFTFYTEMEYLLDAHEGEDSYFYVWSHFRFFATKWMAVGIAGGRNRVFQNDVKVQRGVSLGFSKGKSAITGFYYNPFTPENYGAVSLFRKF